MGEQQIVYAVALEIVSIQQYVFGSNKLKENLGASFLVEDVYDMLLAEAFQEVFPGNSFKLTEWETSPAKIFKQHDGFDVGYIGGGNALLLFKEKAKAQEFIETWTKLLLVRTPGMTTAAVCDELDLSDDKFKKSRKELFVKLQQHKSRYIPQTMLPRHGITAQCRRSGLSMEIWYAPGDDDTNDRSEYVSSSSNAKLKGADGAQSKLEKLFSSRTDAKEIVEKYHFTDQLDNLGQTSDEDSHIAIVHIDGNSIGKRFQKTNTLEEAANLARTVRKATENAFLETVKAIDEQFEDIRTKTGCTIRRKGKKDIIPLRPIIIGGDDITFVTDGRLGIYFAKIFMEKFAAQAVSDNESLSACAGVAITKNKFPFYRGYTLAEALCSNAKQRRREQKSEGCWLDFHIAYGGFSGSLEEIRRAHYQHYRDESDRLQQGLLFRPYCLEKNGEFAFENLVKNAAQLQADFPNLKIKDLRSALTQGEEATRIFIDEQRYRGRELPKIPEKRDYHTKGIVGGKTPYFDMIELMEYYPEFVLKRKKEANHDHTEA